jgi:hypothetical protein
MSSADFAAAQARIAARRQQREAQARAHHAHLLDTQNAAVGRLPTPLRSVGHAGFSLWNTISGREGTRPAFRVGQVDAELLDEELLELLKGQVGEALKYLGTQLSAEYSAEILLALRAVLFKLTIWDHNASYGAALQGLRYTDARDKSLARPPPKRWQKAVYGLVTVFGRYGWEKWEQYLTDVEGGFDEVCFVSSGYSEDVHIGAANANDTTPVEIDYHARYNTLSCCARIIPHIPLQRDAPHSPRSHSPVTPCAAVFAHEPRSFLRVPQSPACLACIH